jgi:phosphatidate cytidylyltransferase
LGKQIWLPIISIAALFAILLQAILRYEQKHDSAPVDFLINLGGVLYIGGLGLHFLFVRELPSGGLWFLFFVMVTAVGDTGAYLIGQRWGKHKMGNRVSPNKSWEGYLAGIVTAGLVGLVFAIVAGNWFPLDVLEGTAFAVALYIVIPIGDFGISLFKRWAGVKNTGNLLPGHGGILDRIDTHLWTMTMGYYILKFLVFAG